MTRFHQHRCLLVLAALMLAIGASGCVWMRDRLAGGSRAPVPCAIAEDATARQIVMHLNDNTRKLHGWRTTRAKIATHGSLVPKADATIVVESPRNFRLVAANPMGGKEVDLGSNSEQFWFWVRRNEEKQVVVASHDLDPERMRKFPFPFQPDWILETMGVIEIDPDEDLTLEPGPPGKDLVKLIASRTSPQGFKVRKVTVVDRRLGVIREHALYDPRNQLIARAVLSQHTTRVSPILPMRIDLEWPQAQVGLTMTLSDVEVNPAHYSQKTWTLPNFEGYTIFDLNR